MRVHTRLSYCKQRRLRCCSFASSSFTLCGMDFVAGTSSKLAYCPLSLEKSTRAADADVLCAGSSLA